MQEQTDLDHGSGTLRRYLPLVVWVGAVLVGLLIPLKILSLGFIPGDDSMRHVAKALSGKSWPEILVVREGFGDDEHPGWHAMLGALHRWFNWDADSLLTFSVCAPFVVFWLAMVATRRRPEAILLAFFAASLAAPATFVRLLYGRPFIFIAIVYIIVLQLWAGPRKNSVWRLALSAGLIGVSVWLHGSWYLFGILIAAFVLAGEWRKAFSLTGCWLAGVFLGASLTGRPFGYIKETFLHLFGCFQGHPLERMLVTELRPDPGDLILVVAVGLVLIWRVARGEWKRAAVWNPVFVLAALGWLLGLKVSRFWTDWGFPATLLWLGMEIENVLETRLNRGSWQTLMLAAFAGAGVYLATTRDLGDRWTRNLTYEYLTPAPDHPDLVGWLPDPGGIIYNSDMEVFFRTFYKNPTADWRYVLGFEPGIMTLEDLEIFRKIQWTGYATKAYEPWVRRMRSADRMIFFQGAANPPGIKGLEWYYAATDTWIGRLPRETPPASPAPTAPR